ncbi:MAG: phosphoenolpyruvate synthase, partial [Bacteroidia bacterium]|nr:phosphoenolpyruvate synthase [Bacteroidia bacterium]
MNIKTVLFFLICIYLLTSSSVIAQTAVSNEKIAAQIITYKNDIRGTYKSIRWFCKDGTIRQPQDPCPNEIGGIQHATYKDEVVALGKSNHIFLGQILAYTDKSDFWDGQHNHSRLKQYQLGKYLSGIDNGWVNQKGQYYRGAIQIEDEEEWGVKFYQWLLAKDDVILKDYFLIMQSLKDVPHKGDDDLSQLMRVQSKVISDQYTKFMDLRVKIHSNPEVVDIDKVKQFKKENITKLTPALLKKMDELVVTMQNFHKPVDLKKVGIQVNTLSPNSSLTKALKAYIKSNASNESPSQLSSATANILLQIRKELPAEKNALGRLKILDISNQLQTLVFKQSGLWNPANIGEQLEKIYALSMAAAATGAIELWEWEKVEPILRPRSQRSLKLEELTEKLETARSIVEWSTA